MAHHQGGRNTRTYDNPKTPYQRAVDSGVLIGEQALRLQALHADTNPAELTRNINRIQHLLIASAKDKTLTMRDKVS